MTRSAALAWLVVLAILVLAAVLLSPYRLGLLAFVAAYAIASLAQNLLAGYADVPSLGNVIFFACSAFTTAALMSQAHLTFLAAALVGLAASAALGFVVGLPALRISGMHLAIVTVALVFVGQNVIDQWDAAQGLAGVTVNSPAWLLDERGLYITAMVVVVGAYLAIWNLTRGASGRAIRAMRDNPHAALAAGVSLTRYRLTAFSVSAVLTGLGGLIYLYYAHAVTSGSFTLDVSLAFLTMIIVGGSGSIGGSLLGALIIGFLPQAVNALPSQIGTVSVTQSIYLIYASLLLVTLRFAPGGLWNPMTRPLRPRARRRP